MRFAILGTSNFVLACAHGVIDSKHEVVALITLKPELLPDNSADIGKAAKSLGVPSFEISDINAPESIKLLRSLHPDYLFCSWPKIISPEVLELPKYFVIGTHPTDLPANRGRHPLHWCIVLGIPQTFLSFFRMEPGVDTGNILIKVPIEVGDHSIHELAEEAIVAGREGMQKLIQLLERDPEAPGSPQNHAQANYWRARNAHDGIIDFRMCVAQLVRLARSFSPPYTCVKLVFEKFSLPVIEIEPITDHSFTSQQLYQLEPGKILSVGPKEVIAKAADGIARLKLAVEAPGELARAKYIFPPTYYLVKWGVEIFFGNANEGISKK